MKPLDERLREAIEKQEPLHKTQRQLNGFSESCALCRSIRERLALLRVAQAAESTPFMHRTAALTRALEELNEVM